MTTIGRGSAAKIVAACDDGAVRIYDSVTGVLRLSLRPKLRIQEMTGVPDGSLLVCTHKGHPVITLWDIQTGGLVHTFILKGEMEVKHTAVSLKGRYLACETSENTVSFWETASRTQHPDHLEKLEGHTPCWLAPEELIIVVDGGSAHVRNVITKGPSVHKFDLLRSTRSAVYSPIFDQLAIMSHYLLGNTFVILDVKTGTSSTIHGGGKQASFIAFSQTTKRLVCGGEVPGLETVDISTGCWAHFDFPATVTSASVLWNGTVVAVVRGSGVQLLSVDQQHASSRQPTPPPLTMYPLDRGRIIITIPTTNDRVILLETSTMSQILSIHTQEALSVAADHTVVLCASLEDRIAVFCLKGGLDNSLGIWEFYHTHPRWTVQTRIPASVGSISPACNRLATFHKGRSEGFVYVWDAHNGVPLAWIDIGYLRPLDITFDSEDRLCFYHDTHREFYDIRYRSHDTRDPSYDIYDTSYDIYDTCYDDYGMFWGLTAYCITHRPGQRLEGQVLGKRYCLDDGREWVICGSQKICWVPPGYIGFSHCWAGPSLVMVGRDGTLRKLTFMESSL